MALSVLVVDDSRFARRLMQGCVKKIISDAEITMAASGEEALEKLRAGSFDLMLLDLNMPGVDGFGVLEAVKAENIPVKVQVASANIQTLAMERVKALGALGFVKKPISEEKLRSALEEMGMV